MSEETPQVPNKPEEALEQESASVTPPAVPVLPESVPDGDLAALLDQQSSSEEVDAPVPPPAIKSRRPELHEQPADEVFGDTITPNPSVEIGAAILEEISDAQAEEMAKIGVLHLPNHQPEELERIYAHALRVIADQQTHRKMLVENNLGDQLLIVTAQNGTNIFVTEAERILMANIGYYRRIRRQGHGEHLFEANERWINMPKVGDAILGIGKNNFEKSSDDRMKMRGALGMSGEYPAPLWASGMHFKLESPGALDGFHLETKLLLEKIDTSRESMGYALEASTIYLNLPVCDFILDHLFSTTVGTTNRKELENLILLTDLEPLAGAMGAAIYPDGFLLERPCLKSNGGCGHRNHRLINVRRALVVRWDRLSEHQKHFMSRRSAKNDPASIKTYQDQMRPEISRRISLGKGYYLKLKVPTIAQYRRIAGAWMSKLTDGAKELFVSNATQAERENYMEVQANIALIMAFAHWIEAFEYEPDLGGEVKTVVTRVVDDPNKQFEADLAVDNELKDLSADGGQTQRIVNEIKRFIDDMTVSVFVAPKTKCGGCGKPVTGDEASPHPEVVQLNAIEVFFTLLRHKIQNSGK